MAFFGVFGVKNGGENSYLNKNKENKMKIEKTFFEVNKNNKYRPLRC